MLDEPSSPVAPPGLYALLVIGPGVLGAYLGKLWGEEHTGALVTGHTNTAANHHRFAVCSLSFKPDLVADG